MDNNKPVELIELDKETKQVIEEFVKAVNACKEYVSSVVGIPQNKIGKETCHSNTNAFQYKK